MTQYVCESGIEQVLKIGIVPDYSLASYVLNDLERLSLIYDCLKKVSLGYDLRLMPKGLKLKEPFMTLLISLNFIKNNQWILVRSIPPNEYLNRKKYPTVIICMALL